MKITGEAVLQAPLPKVWDALLDPEVLVRTIPGCERLETTGENAYAMTVTVGIAAIKGTYTGSCRIADLVPHESLRLSAEGSGAPGTIAADVDVRFSEDETTGFTVLQYDADTTVGGMIGGVGQRMLASVSRRLATEFFTAVERDVTSGPAAAPDTAPEEATPAGPPRVFTAPAVAPGGAAAPGFLAGVAVGAGLVSLGVVLGAVLGRRR
jgi:carbon monoxide dehydrogenase subunit G